MLTLWDTVMILIYPNVIRVYKHPYLNTCGGSGCQLMLPSTSLDNNEKKGENITLLRNLIQRVSTHYLSTIVRFN